MSGSASVRFDSRSEAERAAVWPTHEPSFESGTTVRVGSPNTACGLPRLAQIVMKDLVPLSPIIPGNIDVDEAIAETVAPVLRSALLALKSRLAEQCNHIARIHADQLDVLLEHGRR